MTHEHCCEHHHHEHDHTHDCCCGHHHDHDHEHEHHHGFTINFDGVIHNDINRVWEILTDNTLVAKWSEGIEFTDFRPGGAFSVTTEQATETYMLLDVEPPTLLTFTWDNGTIALSLSAENEVETMINLSVWLDEIEERSAEHLTNWMINLQCIAALAESIDIEERAIQYAEIYPKMQEMLSLETTDSVEFE